MAKKTSGKKDKLKIVHICSYFQPELGYEEYYTAYFQKQMGHDVYVVTSDRLFPFKNIEKMLKQAGEKNTSRIRFTGFKEIDGIKVYRQPIIIETLYDFMLVKGVKKVLQEIQPDIVQGHGGKEGTPAQGAYYKDKLGYEFVCDSHDFYFDQHVLIRKIKSWKDVVAKLDYIFFRKHLGAYTYKKAAKVIAVTPDVKDFAVDFNGVSPKKVVVTSLGADTEYFNYDPEARKRIRKKLGYKDSDVVVLHAGILSRRKKTERVFEVFGKIHKKYPEAKLLIVGEGEGGYQKELEKLAKKLGISKAVKFTGFIGRKEMPDYLSASDIGAWLNNNSVLMMEAAACALPQVIPDMQLSHVVGYDNGFKFEQADEKAFQKYVEKLISDPALREKMSKNARKAAVKHYSYKTNAARLVELYKEVLKKNRR